MLQRPSSVRHLGADQLVMIVALARRSGSIPRDIIGYAGKTPEHAVKTVADETLGL
jgi:hypothetical protein